MNVIKRNFPYLILNVIGFYGLPLLMSGNFVDAFTLLLMVIPFICFLAALLSGHKNGIDVFYLIAVVALFLPSIFLYYNQTAMVYGVIYGVIALIGSVLGDYIQKKERKKF